MVRIVWFKRDLRVQDNAALRHAAHGAVIPLYIVEPEYWAQPDSSARQWAFVSECLEGLSQDLAGLGAPLVVRMGDAVEVLSQLHAAHGVSEIVSHEETGNLWTYARDRRVQAWARGAGVVWRQFPSGGVVRRLPSRDGWARARDQVMSAALIAPPTALKSVEGVATQRLPSAHDLNLPLDACAQRQTGGRAQGLSLLGGFLTERGQTYRRAMASPLEGEWACSRLSPFLAFGALSLREAAQAARARKAEVKGQRSGWTGAMRSFEARLAWHDHFKQKLEDAPRIETHCLHRAYENLRPRDSDPARLDAWAQGETGLPFVDACMRFLRAGGWLNFRARAMVVSVASYHLWLDWRSHGPVLARMFTDYEPGIHWPQVQMQSGTTGMNTVRVYNPVKQGHDNDPSGTFTRRWCPELAEVPDAYLQEPWLWSGAAGLLGRRYPDPIVDVKAAAKAARDAVWAIRKGDRFRDEAAALFEKHASRKDPQGRFVNDRAPRRKRKPPRSSDQMELDL